MMEFDGKKTKTVGGIAAGVIVALSVGFEYFYLRGEMVYSTSARLGDTVKFTVSKPNQPHLLVVRDDHLRKRRGAYLLNLAILNPDGKEIAKWDESIPRKKTRYVDFTPEKSGEFTIKISGKGVTRNPRLSLRVLVNDKRITRLFF